MNISLASLNDIPGIMSFINTEWKEGHILARDEDFFRYEHEYKDQVNFVISKDKDMQINGVLGFIPSALDEESDVNTVIWKVAKNTENPILGIQLLQYLQTVEGIRTVLSVGINKKTIGIYQYLGMYTNSLDHYVIINKDISEYKIAKIANPENFHDSKPTLNEKYAVKLIKGEVELSGFDFEKYRQNISYKNGKYFTKRYFQHPVYQYDVYGAYAEDKIVGLLVTRIQSYNESKALRIVDFIGEESCLESFGKFFSEVIAKEGYEYADFYCFGLDKEILKNAGFYTIDPLGQDLIVPNYFAPFVQQNVTINFFANTDKVMNLRLFKADGDQDRPN